MSQKNQPAIGGYSPVSYFEHGRAERGSPAHQARHDGHTYYFTSAQQAETFQAQPEKYAPAFGGTCAFGHVIGKDLEIDPESFKIVDGKLLLFKKSDGVDALALWNKEGDAACMLKAQARWENRVSA